MLTSSMMLQGSTEAILYPIERESTVLLDLATSGENFYITIEARDMATIAFIIEADSHDISIK